MTAAVLITPARCLRTVVFCCSLCLEVPKKKDGRETQSKCLTKYANATCLYNCTAYSRFTGNKTSPSPRLLSQVHLYQVYPRIKGRTETRSPLLSSAAELQWENLHCWTVITVLYRYCAFSAFFLSFFVNCWLFWGLQFTS